MANNFTVLVGRKILSAPLYRYSDTDTLIEWLYEKDFICDKHHKALQKIWAKQVLYQNGFINAIQWTVNSVQFPGRNDAYKMLINEGYEYKCSSWQAKKTAKDV